MEKVVFGSLSAIASSLEEDARRAYGHARKAKDECAKAAFNGEGNAYKGAASFLRNVELLPPEPSDTASDLG